VAWGVRGLGERTRRAWVTAFRSVLLRFQDHAGSSPFRRPCQGTGPPRGVVEALAADTRGQDESTARSPIPQSVESLREAHEPERIVPVPPQRSANTIYIQSPGTKHDCSLNMMGLPVRMAPAGEASDGRSLRYAWVDEWRTYVFAMISSPLACHVGKTGSRPDPPTSET